MAEDDIYKSKSKYESFVKDLGRLVKIDNSKRDYYCKNPKNIIYFKKMTSYFEVKDLSYVRRMRLFSTLLMICHATSKSLEKCAREDINDIVAFMHTKYTAPASKESFIKNIKLFWRVLFPEKDSFGRVDETITPYPVRHLTTKIEKSKEKLKKDKMGVDEYEKLIRYFEYDPRMQAYLTLALESLGRPQEILYTKISDLEIYDNYAKIWISEHGKEGTGFLQCIDSFPYMAKWLRVHPDKSNKDSFIFVNTGQKNQGKQLTPFNINRAIKLACKRLSIEKPITCYSLKRNGVTFRRLRGDSDTQIQHAARWTSTKQLKIYDQSDQNDAFRIELTKKGILKANSPDFKKYEPKTKTCMCGQINGFTDEFCSKCLRPLDREKVMELEKKKELDALNRFMDTPEMQKLFKTMVVLQEKLQI